MSGLARAPRPAPHVESSASAGRSPEAPASGWNAGTVPELEEEPLGLLDAFDVAGDLDATADGADWAMDTELDDLDDRLDAIGAVGPPALDDAPADPGFGPTPDHDLPDPGFAPTPDRDTPDPGFAPSDHDTGSDQEQADSGVDDSVAASDGVGPGASPSSAGLARPDGAADGASDGGAPATDVAASGPATSDAVDVPTGGGSLPAAAGPASTGGGGPAAAPGLEGGGPGVGGEREPHPPVLSRFLKELDGKSPEEVEAHIDQQAAAFESDAAGWRADLSGSAQTLAGQVDGWAAEQVGAIEGEAAGYQDLSGVFAGSRATLDGALLDAPQRVQAASELGMSAIADKAAALRSEAADAFDPLPAGIESTRAGFAATHGTLVAAAQGRVRDAATTRGVRATGMAQVVAKQQAAEARTARAKAAAVAIGDDDDDKTKKRKSQQRKQLRADATLKDKLATVATQAGAQAASRIGMAGTTHAGLIGAQAPIGLSAISGRAAEANRAVEDGKRAVLASVDTAEADALARADTALPTTLQDARDAAHAQLDTAEEALTATVLADITKAKSDVEAMAIAAKTTLPVGAVAVLVAFDASVAEVVATCRGLKGNQDPQAVGAALAQARTALGEARTRAGTDLEAAGTTVHDDMAAVATGLTTGLKAKVDQAGTDAETTVTDFTTQGEADVAGFESAMAGIGEALDADVRPTLTEQSSSASSAALSLPILLAGDAAAVGTSLAGIEQGALAYMDGVIAQLPTIFSGGAIRIAQQPDLSAADAVSQAHAVADVLGGRKETALLSRVKTLVDNKGGGAMTLEALRGLDDQQRQAVTLMYAQQTGGDLLTDLRARLQGDASLEAAEAYLTGGKAAGALVELAAANGSFEFNADRAEYALQFLGPADLAELKRLAASHPELADVLDEANAVIDKTKVAAEADDAALQGSDPKIWKQLGVDLSDPRSLAEVRPRDLKKAIDAGTIDRESLIALAKRMGMPPECYGGLDYISDPEREEKDAGREAGLLLDFIDIDMNGAMADTANLFGSPMAQAENKAQLASLYMQIRTQMSDGKIDPTTLQTLRAQYKALDKRHHQLFNDKMDNLDTAVAVATVVKDGIKWVSKKVAYVGTAILTGGNLAAANAAEATWSGALEGIETFATETIVNDRDAGTALEYAAQDAAFTAGKDFSTGLLPGGTFAKDAANVVAGTGFDTVHNTLKKTREYNTAYDEAMADGKLDPRERAALRDPKSLGNIVATEGSKALLSNSLGKVSDKVGGDKLTGKVVSSVVEHNLNQIGSKTIDNVSGQVHSGAHIDLIKAAGDAAEAHWKALQSGKGLVENIGAPVAKGAQGAVEGKVKAAIGEWGQQNKSRKDPHMRPEDGNAYWSGGKQHKVVESREDGTATLIDEATGTVTNVRWRPAATGEDGAPGSSGGTGHEPPSSPPPSAGGEEDPDRTRIMTPEEVEAVKAASAKGDDPDPTRIRTPEEVEAVEHASGVARVERDLEALDLADIDPHELALTEHGHPSGMTFREFHSAYLSNLANPDDSVYATDPTRLLDLYQSDHVLSAKGRPVLSAEAERIEAVPAGAPTVFDAADTADALPRKELRDVELAEDGTVEGLEEHDAALDLEHVQDVRWQAQREAEAAEAAGDADAAKDAHRRMREASEGAGEAAGRIWADAHLPGHASISDAIGAGVADQVYRGPDGAIVVVEAKGGAAGLGFRNSVDGRRAQQGTAEYLESLANTMATRDPALAAEIRAALRAGKVRYVKVQQPFLPDGSLDQARAQDYAIAVSADMRSRLGEEVGIDVAP